MLSHRDPKTLRVHPLNPRTSRPKVDVERLADRMRRIGFDATRAPWAIGDLVFAGATRVAASVMAGIDSIPVLLHNDLADEEVVRLADQDNESDEYHVKVPLLDVWSSYASLADDGWTQERIARAKGCDRSTVANRLRLHRELPASARAAALAGLLDEGHCQAILAVVLDVQQFAPWLTTEVARAELVRDLTVSAPDTRHRGKLGPTVDQVRAGAARWKALIAHAVEAYEALPIPHREAFVSELARAKARALHDVDAALASIHAQVPERESIPSPLPARAAVVAALVKRVHHGDARKLVGRAPEGYRLLLTDPPYGIALGGGRSTRAKRSVIAGDATPGDALALLDATLPVLFERMAEGGTAFVFTGWKNEPRFRAALVRAGFRIVGSLVWAKSNHGTASEHLFAPKHERILHAVKGKPSTLRRRHPDLIEAPANQKTEHPTEKPDALLRVLIEATTRRGDVVVDPFCGSGSTLVAAHAMGRAFWGCEIDARWTALARERVAQGVAELL